MIVVETVEVAVVVVVGVEVAEVVWLLACVHSFMCVQCVLWWRRGGEVRRLFACSDLFKLHGCYPHHQRRRHLLSRASRLFSVVTVNVSCTGFPSAFVKTCSDSVCSFFTTLPSFPITILFCAIDLTINACETSTAPAFVHTAVAL